LFLYDGPDMSPSVPLSATRADNTRGQIRGVGCGRISTATASYPTSASSREGWRSLALIPCASLITRRKWVTGGELRSCSSRGLTAGSSSISGRDFLPFVNPSLSNFFPHLHDRLTMNPARIIARPMMQHGHEDTQQSVANTA